MGITGQDMLLDCAPRPRRSTAGLRPLTFRFGARRDAQRVELQGSRIATSYGNLVGLSRPARHQAEVVHLDGAVESSIRLGSPT